MTEMKQLLALLLLGLFLTVRGEKGAEKKDPCTQGLAAVEVFVEYRGCPDPEPRQIVNEIKSSMNLTERSLIYLFTNYCSVVFPRLEQCFRGNIQNCSIPQQASLMRVVHQTGFLCEPDTTRIHPVISYLLAQLTDADLVENEECNIENMMDIYGVCANRSFQAIGVSMANHDISDVLGGLSLEQLAPKIQTYMRTMIECIVNKIYDNQQGCPQWRGRALLALQDIVLPEIPGFNMTFTFAEIDRLFHWESFLQTQNTDQSQQSIWFQ